MAVMALSESRRRKLEMLTRCLAGGKVKDAQAVIDALHTPSRVTGPALPVQLAQAAPGIEQHNAAGTYWLIRRPLLEVSAELAGFPREYAAILRGSRQRFDELKASPALCHIANGLPDGPLFMDIETCGLAGCSIFLVGLMSFQGDELMFEQLLARHYGEERAILAEFADRLAGSATLVTFNGKAFDMNSLRDRGAFHGVDLGFTPPHCDLLHESRRLWKGQVPNCKLQTLEQFFCRRRRVGDIPGRDIPDAYHRFVSGGDAREMTMILHHNLLDLLTMAQLLCAALSGEQPDLSA